ncbi:MAG: glucose 1-dehydrogenase [Dehalococcoidia bacterium]
MSSFAGKSIIVTGGGSGVGRSAATIIAARGGRVVVADQNETTGMETEKLIRDAGGTAVFVKTNIASEKDVRNMVNVAVSEFGRLDGGFNNAAIPQHNVKIVDMTLDIWQKCIDIDLTGTFLCVKYEIEAMLKTGGGAIVNTSSTCGVTAFPLAAEYCAAKHGVIGLTRAAALDYGTQGIRVNAVIPAATRTPMLMKLINELPEMEDHLNKMHPIGRYAEANEVALGAIWLLSDEASFVTGTALTVDGGFTAT